MVLITLVLYLAAPLARSQLAVDPRIYQLPPSGGYRFINNPSHFYVPGRDVCMVEEVPALNMTFPLPWTHGTFCSHKTYLQRQCCEGFGSSALEFGCPVVEKVVDVMTAMRRIPKAQKFSQLMNLHSMDRKHLGRFFETPPDALTLLVPLDEVRQRLLLLYIAAISLRMGMINEDLLNPYENCVVQSVSCRSMCGQNIWQNVMVGEYNKELTQPLTKLHMLFVKNLSRFQKSKKYFPPSTLILTKGFREADNFTASELGRVVEIFRGHTSPLLLYHMLPRRWYLRHLYDNQQLRTLYQDTSVTVTKLSNKMVLFNCVPVHRVDVHARDGVLHVLQRPLPPSYVVSLVDLISMDPDLTMFFTLLGYADLLGWLRSVDSITVMAPTNAAFKRLPLRFLDSITYDVKYFTALQALSRNHLMEGIECSLGLRAKVRVKTLEGITLPVTCSSSFNLSLNSAFVTRPDVVTSNGVLHYIDKVMIPPRAMSLVQVTRRAGATKFIELVKEVGLFDDLVSFGPYTIFAPSNGAFKKLNDSLFNNKDALRSLVMYHLVAGSHASFTLLDNQVLPTLLQDTFLRLKVHARVMSAEDGIVTSGDHVAFNGYVHVVDRVLHPPVYSIARVLARNPNLRRFTSLVTQSGIALWRELSLEKGPYTLFAVPDDDMDRWASDLFTYYRLINDERLLNRSLSAHILDDFVMPRALEEGSHSVLRPRLKRPGRHGYPLRLTVSEGRLSLRHASISKNFVLCTNGIILFIDTLLLP
ncbi:transforming growth factor-beta-induced protein ig-h3-like [Macrobrachium rosenbergii]|uniref:transforming growth factor-beta-induced protein ig-h3-like n=1 Tax=Macrobrachium rosenbergii TaxID=79674 RepID=UPI0034D7088F